MAGFDFFLQYLPTLPLFVTIPLFVMGLVLAFFGRVIFYHLLFVFGGIIVGGGFALVFFLTGQEAWFVFLGGIGGFVGGGIFSILMFRAVLFLFGAFVGGAIGVVCFPDNFLIVAIIAGICGIAFIFLFDALLPLSTAIQGGSIIGLGVLLSGMGIGPAGFSFLLIAIFGAIFQLFGPVKNMKQRGKSPGQKDRSKNWYTQRGYNQRKRQDSEDDENPDRRQDSDDDEDSKNINPFYLG